MSSKIILQLDSKRTSLDVLSSWDTYTLFHRASKNIVQVCPPILRDPSSLGQTSASIPAGCMQSGWGPLNLLLALLIHAGDETYGYTRPVIRPSVAHVVDRASAPASGASSTGSRAGTGEDNGSGTGTGALDVEMEAGGSPAEKEEETSQGHERSGGEALSMAEGDSGYERDQRNPGLEEINEGRGERASAKENDEETEDQNDLSSDSTELFTPPAYTKVGPSVSLLPFTRPR